MLRTHTCGQLRKSDQGATVVLCGWVHRRRDHGGIIFIDLRDRYGLTQVKFDPAISPAIWDKANDLRSEWVVKVTGQVVPRPAEMVNAKLKTGEIEVPVSALEILNRAATPPFALDEEKGALVNEGIRLKYRFLDLRRSALQEILRQRDELIRFVREYFHRRDFLEVQTPILANSSPEGARDYLVPSRLYPGKFYALPQAPQQFKQLLMVGGLDRYFQIAPCFRDEDPRADRHPGDFYQIDLEMSFVEQEDIWDIVEPLMVELTEKFSAKKIITKPFPRLTYQEAMDKYGSDKPDLRFALEIVDVTGWAADSGFSVFAEAARAGGVVRALPVLGGASLSRKEIDELTEIACAKGAKGLAYIIIKENGDLHSPIVKFLGEELARKIIAQSRAQAGDLVFFGADEKKTVRAVLGAVRSECGRRLGLADKNLAAWCWITDFPMYEYSELEPGKIDFCHNPFSMPQGGLSALKEKNPLDILAFQYDLVCNGCEISSGAIRNHDPEIMYAAFALAGYKQEEVDRKFGHMIRAFSYGAPPHGGIAPGLDRLLMILLDVESIRDIYAFPKDGQARDAMMDSPSEVSEKQLKELGLKPAFGKK
ncbi:aspartate--tRNA ligase [Candidatus Falkowbacteria bacterium CG_4_10_14_0_2_um_filter_48_10]|nr:MAG: aspartate--tRNA ligase [Candidatus Falkowbacteria bacterium CG_4_10_14_0_2_um_filter_48_10]